MRNLLKAEFLLLHNELFQSNQNIFYSSPLFSSLPLGFDSIYPNPSLLFHSQRFIIKHFCPKGQRHTSSHTYDTTSNTCFTNVHLNVEKKMYSLLRGKKHFKNYQHYLTLVLRHDHLPKHFQAHIV